MKHQGRVEAEIPNHAIAEEAPKYDRPHTDSRCGPRRSTAPEFVSQNVQDDLLALLRSPDLCSKRQIWQQYDWSVRTNTLVPPGGADAAVVRVKETGVSLAISLDGNGRYCYLDPREGAKLNVAECCRNLSTVGALPVAATNNLNFGNPERPEIMAQLVEAIEGIAEACEFFETPITGRQCQPLQRNAGRRHLSHARCWGLSGAADGKAGSPARSRTKAAPSCCWAEFVSQIGVNSAARNTRRPSLANSGALRPRSIWLMKSACKPRCEKLPAAGLAESAHDL